MRCWRCWGPTLPYWAVLISLSAWWLALPPAPDNEFYVGQPRSQEVMMLDVGVDDEQGMMVTIMPAPDFSGTGLSEGRKQQFVTWLLPLIGEENMHIGALRKEAVKLYHLSQTKRLSLKQKEWLLNVALDYEVDIDKKGFDLQFWQSLLHRLDIIPPSLVLTQAALESGWGSSRLAREGNNFFGMMCFKSGCGMHSPGVKGEFRRFDSPQSAVSSYMRLINTKGAYRTARSERMQNRLLGEMPSGVSMAKTLLSYSELGRGYVMLLMRIMQENHLDDYDGADGLSTLEPVVNP